jgi:hypothetical protein
MQKYITCKEVTKEILDSLAVGDLVKINDWARPMTVRGVSENYAVMTQNVFGQLNNSIIEKKPWGGKKHFDMVGGRFHYGPDTQFFCSPVFEYEFDNDESIKKYLNSYETGESKLLHRYAKPIHEIQYKKCDRK